MLLQLFTYCALAQDETEKPPQPLEAWGVYSEDTADAYDQEPQPMVWISFSQNEFKNGGVQDKYFSAVKKAKEETEAKVGTKHHWVYFDTEAYNDHATEGLGCKELPCVSIISPIQEDDELVYTKPLTFAEGKFESAIEEVKAFVELVKDGKADEFKHEPSDEGPPMEPEDDDEDFEDEDDEQEV